MSTALITGASSGIGAEFARQLAAQHQHLVLVARSQDKLDHIAEQMHQQHGIQTTVIAQDLTVPQAALSVQRKVEALGLTINLLVNNAGFGTYGPFSQEPLAQQTAMIQLNIMALVELTHLFLPGMLAKSRGGIINVSSIGGFQPMPYWSVYAASKAFVLSFSEALWAEVKDQGVNVLALCPGPTESEFFKVANLPSNVNMGGTLGQLDSPRDVVRAALNALNKGQANMVTGGVMNQVIVNMSRLMPRETLVSLIEQQFRGG